ncbi:SDR family oxidoreductase [Microcoleus sp. FACHB-1515]|uniref:SDR family NAD(P)-dependent oxidoreductase n=1 Tax=Cyanophyceae TaxID=3028117 RepID=UPI0016890803|nr:SDR family oxidoreductase [Microcoleus sp. FACHB-1515]MBD2088553.1 SDR family oxidoreductase [Microcoleus sp. FACHB-1515]
MTQTALITGASHGIGRATALELACNGYDVVLAARTIDRLEAVAEEIRAIGRQAFVIQTDVRDRNQVDDLVQKAIGFLGSIDVLVNNAGVYYMGPVEAASIEDWQQIIQTNVWGYIHTIHALLPHFLERESGTIVNVVSIGGLDPIPYQVPYTTSKHALTGLTKSLHHELKPKGIHVCGIYPSFIRTELYERALFRGKEKQTERDRYDFVYGMFHSPILEKPEVVAKAIRKAIEQKRGDVLVGTANFWSAAFHLTPAIMIPIVRRVFGMRDRLVKRQ